MICIPQNFRIMDNRKEMELEILITIRNNETVPCNEFYRLFDGHWLPYRKIFNVLYEQGLFIISGPQDMPGANRFELTRIGNGIVSKLLDERSQDIHAHIAQLQNLKDDQPSPKWNPLSGLIHFITLLLNPFKRPVH
jgi:hypothetical protein